MNTTTTTQPPARRILSHEVWPGMRIRLLATGNEYKVIEIHQGNAELRLMTGPHAGQWHTLDLAAMGREGIELVGREKRNQQGSQA